MIVVNNFYPPPTLKKLIFDKTIKNIAPLTNKFYTFPSALRSRDFGQYLSYFPCKKLMYIPQTAACEGAL